MTYEVLYPEDDKSTESSPPCERRKIDAPPNTELDLLLDFSSPALSSNSSIADRFDHIAELLFTRYHLVVSLPDTSTSSEEYDILEVEFYLNKEGCHEDPYTHGSEEQCIGGQWYFHRANGPSGVALLSSTSSPGYRGGTRKGLDITLGGRLAAHPQRSHKSRYFTTSSLDTAASNAINVRGGILLRSIRRLRDFCVISGPSLLVDELLRASAASSIIDLVQGHWHGDISVFESSSRRLKSSLYLKRLASDMIPSRCPRIYRSPRVGLDLSHSSVTLDARDSRIHFVIKPYRYFIHPHLLTAKGRAQTFLGVYDRIICEAPDKDEPTIIAELAQLTVIKPQTTRAYLDTYRDARSSGTLKSFVGAAAKCASSAPTTVLKLHGSARRFMEAQRRMDPSSALDQEAESKRSIEVSQIQ